MGPDFFKEFMARKFKVLHTQAMDADGNYHKQDSIVTDEQLGEKLVELHIERGAIEEVEEPKPAKPSKPGKEEKPPEK